MNYDESQADSSTANESWQFDEGEIIRQEHEPHAPGDIPLGKEEYKIIRLLTEVGSGLRFYHVKTEETGTHLYSAAAVESGYETIEKAESRVWGDA